MINSTPGPAGIPALNVAAAPTPTAFTGDASNVPAPFSARYVRGAALTAHFRQLVDRTLERRHSAYRRNDYSDLLTVPTSIAVIAAGLRTTLPTCRPAGTTLNTLSTKVTAHARGSMTDVLARGVFWCARTTPRASRLSVVPEVMPREAVVRGEQYLIRSRASRRH